MTIENPVWTPRTQRRLELTPTSHQDLFRKCWDGKAAMIEAIQGMCLECQGFDKVGIAECGDRLCPLWKYRPYQPKLTA